MFDRDYAFDEEDDLFPSRKDSPENCIVICKSENNKTYIGPFTLEGAKYYSESSPYRDCKHKIVQLFSPDIV